MLWKALKVTETEVSRISMRLFCSTGEQSLPIPWCLFLQDLLHCPLVKGQHSDFKAILSKGQTGRAQLQISISPPTTSVEVWDSTPVTGFKAGRLSALLTQLLPTRTPVQVEYEKTSNPLSIQSGVKQQIALLMQLSSENNNHAGAEKFILPKFREQPYLGPLTEEGKGLVQHGTVCTWGVWIRTFLGVRQ